MSFTYAWYQDFLALLQSCGYAIADYHNWQSYNQCVILRHDVDFSLENAICIARIEQKSAVKSTYFVLVCSDFYNVFSRKNCELIQEICMMGHEIGLHFDEAAYPEISGDAEKIQEAILRERVLLENVVNRSITTVSMHRPSRTILDSDLQIPSMINSYSNTFFQQFKYLSDSRRCWREPVCDIIERKEYDKLHVLTHAFWYHEEEQNMEQTVNQFVSNGSVERYNTMMENISDLDKIVKKLN